ncbi:L,D-transpeptidase [Candidatus Methylacidiphilum infernorum]|uniref:L,D-transpeptidase n=1 Tax=Candidatus Methylacidiphilum infernorum TaxID=511746 RepID=UPI0002E7F135|nr:L,D-transpeptidase [Candidatus Methylacidiphilum infernorum]
MEKIRRSCCKFSFFFFLCVPILVAQPANRASQAQRTAVLGNRIVKVSLQNQLVYVQEGNRTIFVAACTVGKAGHPTPKGVFQVVSKSVKKRSHSYGFWVKGNDIRPTENPLQPPPGGNWQYVGYPMPYWIEFSPGYGFHEGFVWSSPRTHGCVRLHGRTAIEFFNLVNVGTKIIIQDSFPEDQTLGRHIRRPKDELVPDPPAQFMISDEAFEKPWEF